MIQVFFWWLILQGIGLAALPAAFRILGWLPDRGYTFAKMLGLLLSGYILWLGASTGFIRNSTGGILFSIFLVAGLSAWLYLRKPRDASDPDGSLLAFYRRKLGLIITTEVLFTVAFIVWVIVRAYASGKIMPAGGEKFMETAFQNGILNSAHFPPLDPWLSGFAISYYYFGYVLMAILTRLSGVLPGVGFELMDALLFALAATGVFGLVYNLVASAKARQAGERDDRQALSYGLFGSLLVIVMGNLEGFLEALHARGLLPESFWNWLGIPGLAQAPVTGSWIPGSYWFETWWRASRVIQDRGLNFQPLALNPITEFPMFSFQLGDNHPHVLALPFVLLSIGLAFNLLRRLTLQSNDSLSGESWNPVKFAFGGDWTLFFLHALILGGLGFLNTWDMPIYMGLFALSYGVGIYAMRRRLDWDLLIRVILLGASLLFFGVLFYLFFYLGFSSQAGGILPYIFPSTPLHQYLVIFGVFVFILLPFLWVRLSASAKQGRASGLFPAVLRSWLWAAGVAAGIFILAISLAALIVFGASLTGEAAGAVQSVLGGMQPAQALQAILLSRLRDPWLFLLLTFLLGLTVINLSWRSRPTNSVEQSVETENADFSGSDLFTFILVFTGLVLTFSVEFFYLRDVFGARMNTVFKFYYQAWIMLGVASAYGMWWLLNPGRQYVNRVARSVFIFAAGLLIAAGMVYPLLGTYSRVNGFNSQPDLNGASEIARNNPDDWAAILWLRENLVGDGPPAPGSLPVILEAPGGNYDYKGRISAFSGLPALLGWSNHEFQWRGTYDEQGKREPDIQTIYVTHNDQVTLDLLHKWDIRYVVVGGTEKFYIQQLCQEASRRCNLQRALTKFDIALTPVFQQGDMTIYAVPAPQAAQ